MLKSFLDTKDEEPFDFYREFRKGGPVQWDDRMAAWVVLGYDECRQLQMNERLFEHPTHAQEKSGAVYGGSSSILLLQGDRHTAMHRLLLAHFSPSVVEDYRRRLIAPLVTRMLDELDHRRRVEFSTELAAKLPTDVISGLLGLDWEDDGLLEACRGWNTDLFRFAETFGEDPDQTRIALNASRHLNDVLLPVIHDRRAHPREDLISLLWDEGRDVFEELDEGDVLAQCRALFFAGSDTTAHLLRNALFVLAMEPGYQVSLREQPAQILDFVEEVLRLYGPIHFRIRVAREDCQLGGAAIKKGDRLHPINAAANRDPSHYHDPEQFDAGRKPLRDHLAFSVGPRFCVGAGLARVEAAELIEQILGRGRQFRLDPDAESPRFMGYMPRSYRPLNVVVG